MRFLPKLLLLLSLPAGLAGYFLGAQLVAILAPGLSDGVVVLFVSMLAAGLCMAPFLVPFLDQKAKADLAAYRAGQRSAGGADGDRDAGEPGAPSDTR